MNRERARLLPPADSRLGRCAAYRVGAVVLYLAPDEARALAVHLRLPAARVEAAVVQAAPHAEKVWLDRSAGRAPASRELAALVDASPTLPQLRSSTSEFARKRLGAVKCAFKLERDEGTGG